MSEQAKPENKQTNQCADGIGAQKSEQSGAQFTGWINTLSGFSTLAIAVFTLFLCAATIGLVCVGRKQLETTRVLERAYIGVKPRGVYSFWDVPNYTAHIDFHNAGRLPARELRWAIETPRILRDGAWQPPIPTERPQGNNVITPGTGMTMGSPEFSISSEQLDANIFLYVWGRVEYHDGFTKGRITNFCIRYPMDSFRSDGERKGECVLSAESGRHHTHHNDAT